MAIDNRKADELRVLLAAIKRWQLAVQRYEIGSGLLSRALGWGARTEENVGLALIFSTFLRYELARTNGGNVYAH